MLIVIVLGAGLTLAFGFATLLAALAIDTVCHRRSRASGFGQQGRTVGARQVPHHQHVPARPVSATAG